MDCDLSVVDVHSHSHNITPPCTQFRDTTPANTDVRAAVAAALAQRTGAATGNNATRAPRYAWAVGTQAFCLGTAALYTAQASLAGPWTFSGNLFNQMALNAKVRRRCCV